MPQYGCQKCGSTESVMEMRRVVIFAGPARELQISGIVPSNRCLNPQCNGLTVQCNLDVGSLAGVEPTKIAPAVPAEVSGEDVAAKAREVKMAELLEMKSKMEALEGELVADEKVQGDPDPAGNTADATPIDKGAPTAS